MFNFEFIQIKLRPKAISFMLISLMLLNVFSRSLVSGIKLWISENTVKESKILQKVGDDLLVKIPISLPYHQNWDKVLDEGLITIFEGEFYESNFQKYENDTLFTTYRKIQMDRNHIYSLFENLNVSIKSLEKKQNDPIQKNVELLENFAKHYFDNKYSCLCFYKVENISKVNFVEFKSGLLKGSDLPKTPPPNISYI